MPTGIDPSRGLLFGLLALQNGLIDQDQLVGAFRVWSRDSTRSLADRLVDRGDLDAEQRALIDGLVAQHLKKHGGSAGRSLATLDVDRIRQDLAHIDGPLIEATLGHIPMRAPVDTSRVRTLTPIAREPTRSAPPLPTENGSASSGRTPGADWAPSSWRWTPSSTARSPSSRSSTRTPMTRPVAFASCSRPRSPAGSSIPASCRSMGWVPTTAGAPSTPCALSGATPSRRRSSSSTSRTCRRRTPVAGIAQARCAGSSTSATPSIMPTRAASCTGTSSRAT